MDKATYLEQKRIRDTDTVSRRNLCLDCRRPKKICWCDAIKPFDTRIEICILMHPKEARKENLGTGRMTHLALKNSRIITGINFDTNRELKTLLEDPSRFPILLYPGKKAHNISREPLANMAIEDRTPLLLVIDGTWPCAKTMMRESSILHDLPRLSFDSNRKSRFIIKQQPADYCLSTLESIHEVLDQLDKKGFENLGDSHHHLMDLLQKLVDFQIKCANDPTLNNYSRSSKPFKAPAERSPSLKWGKRNICFD